MLVTFSVAFLAQGLIAFAVTGLERWYPAKAQRHSGRMQNLGIGTITLTTGLLGNAWLGPLTTYAVNATGHGVFVLPSTGWGVLAGIAIYVFAMDLGEYLFHRAQHALPFMWAMHSLHHSDPDFSATTTVRHYWLESSIKSVTVWLAVGILLKASPVILGAYAILSYYNFLTHANVRLNFGRVSWLLNSPAYHRLHHSSSPEHFDCNYAALLPVFDVISSVYRRPCDGEYPDTGLNTDTKPASIFQAVIWPIRTVFAAPESRENLAQQPHQSPQKTTTRLYY